MRRTLLIPMLPVRAVPSPVITTASPLPTATQGAPYNATVLASGGQFPYAWAITATSDPAFTINPSTGVISGTPNLTGTGSITVRVTDAASRTAQVVFSILIAVSNFPVIQTTSPLPAAQQGAAYSFSMAVVPGTGTGPYAWSIIGGSLAAGMSLSVAGVFSGIPLSSETDSLTIKVTDGAGHAATGTFLLVVNPSGVSPVFNLTDFTNAGSILTKAGNITFGTAMNLSASPNTHQANNVWTTAQQDIRAFSTRFTFQLDPPLGPPSGNYIQGISFMVQKTTTPPSVAGFSGIHYAVDSNLCSLGVFNIFDGSQNVPIPTLGVKFDMNPSSQQAYPVGSLANSTGLYVNGGAYGILTPQDDLNPCGIDLHSGRVFACTLVYDGALLTMTLLDVVTGAQCRISWPVDIPAIMVSNTAWIGFGCGQINPNKNNILSWSFTEGVSPRLATPTFSPAPGQYTGTQSISISAPAGASIYYTTNGQQPTTSSTLYTGTPIPLVANALIQAVAIEAGFTDSLVALGNYQIQASGLPTPINFPVGFAGASGLVIPTGYAKLSGSVILLTDNATTAASGAAWYAAPVGVATFRSTFTLKITNANANGMTYCIQNQQPASLQRAGPHQNSWVIGGVLASSGALTGLGYATPTGTNQAEAGLSCSVALAFDLFTRANSIGIYTNGDLPVGAQFDTGLNFGSGHLLNVSLAYDGTTLVVTIQDATTLASFSKSFAINIPATVAGNTAYVGFTGGTGGGTAIQTVTAWTHSSP